MKASTRILAMLTAALLLAPAIAQNSGGTGGDVGNVEVTQASEFNMQDVTPYGTVTIGDYTVYDNPDGGRLVLTANSPDDQHPNIDLVGPNGYWEHFDVDDDPGEEFVIDDLVPGVYSLASSDEGLQLVHTLLEVRAGETLAVDLQLQTMDTAVAAYDPNAYRAYPYGYDSVVGPYETYDNTDLGSITVSSDSVDNSNVTYIVTGPDAFSEDYTGDFTADDLLPGVYVVAATGDGYQISSTTVEVQAAKRAPVKPALVVLAVLDDQTGGSTMMDSDTGGTTEAAPIGDAETGGATGGAQ